MGEASEAGSCGLEQEELDAVAVLDARAVDARFEHQPLSVHQSRWRFLPLTLPGAVVASPSSAYAGRLD
jgi:hypothetical protein